MPKRRAPSKSLTDFEIDDLNMGAAASLFEMARLQSNERSRFGYQRAARAIVELPVSVAELIQAGSLSSVPFIGPSSLRIISEFVAAGASATVESAIARAAKPRTALEGRALRAGFLSQHGMEQVHALPLSKAVVSKRAFRGDLQMHSTWSDGAERIVSLAEACLALGYTCMGVTDHSYGLPVARGMGMADAVRQQVEIDRLNREYAGAFRIFKGVEANVLADGSLDLQPDELEAFEYVVAAPHSLLRRPEDQTERMLRVVRTRGVAILGHPRGRVFDRRPGISADWGLVFEAAAERQVAVELDGNWHRQDLDAALARVALDAGCWFALDSDAHSIGELKFTDFAIAQARLAGIPADRVVNCWPDERLRQWMEERRAG